MYLRNLSLFLTYFFICYLLFSFLLFFFCVFLSFFVYVSAWSGMIIPKSDDYVTREAGNILIDLSFLDILGSDYIIPLFHAHILAWRDRFVRLVDQFWLF